MVLNKTDSSIEALILGGKKGENKHEQKRWLENIVE
jgi:hypothetical protein